MNTTIELSLPQDQLDAIRDNTAANRALFELMNRSHWLDTKEAAERLGVSESTIRNWIDEGWLGGVQVDRVLRFRVDKLDAAFEKRGEFRATHPALLHSAPKRRLA